MRYIEQLQHDKKELTEQLIKANEALADIQVYLLSNKFWQDTTVQVRDILNRLEQLKSAIILK